MRLISRNRLLIIGKIFVFTSRGVDGSPPQREETRGGFWPQVQSPERQQLEVTESHTGGLARGNSSQSCICRSVTKRKRRWDLRDLEPTAQTAEALHLFPGSHYSWRPLQSMLQLTKATCSSLEAVTARVRRKLILMELLEKHPRKGKKKITKQKCSRIILPSTRDLLDLNHRNLQ